MTKGAAKQRGQLVSRDLGCGHSLAVAIKLTSNTESGHCWSKWGLYGTISIWSVPPFSMTSLSSGKIGRRTFSYDIRA